MYFTNFCNAFPVRCRVGIATTTYLDWTGQKQYGHYTTQEATAFWTSVACQMIDW